MATVLLSISINTFYGIYMSVYSDTLTLRLVHPTSPVLLTRNGPPTTRTHLARSEKQRATLTHSEFESRRRALGPPLRQSFALPDEAACMGAILREISEGTSY